MDRNNKIQITLNKSPTDRLYVLEKLSITYFSKLVQILLIFKRVKGMSDL